LSKASGLDAEILIDQCKVNGDGHENITSYCVLKKLEEDGDGVGLMFLIVGILPEVFDNKNF